MSIPEANIAPPAAATPPRVARPGLTLFDYALFAGCVLAWGFSWIGMHLQVGVVAPEISLVWRFAIATPIMLAIAVARGESLRFPLLDHARFLALGATLFSVNFALFYYAAERVNSGLLSVVFSLASVINVAFGAIFLKAPIDARVAAGGLLGVTGMGAMFYPEIAGTHIDRAAMIGLGLSLIGTFIFCAGNMIAAAAHRRALPVFAMSGWGMTYGTILLALFAAARGSPFTVEPTFAYLGSLVYLATIASVMAFACYLTVLGRAGPDRAAYSTVMYPLVALMVSTFAEGYQWTVPAAAGLVAVLAGNLLVLGPRRK